jgi:hypothetical protein
MGRAWLGLGLGLGRGRGLGRSLGLGLGFRLGVGVGLGAGSGLGFSLGVGLGLGSGFGFSLGVEMLLAGEASGRAAPGEGGGAGSEALLWGAAAWPRLRLLTSAMRTTMQSCSRKSTCRHSEGRCECECASAGEGARARASRRRARVRTSARTTVSEGAGAVRVRAQVPPRRLWRGAGSAHRKRQVAVGAGVAEALGHLLAQQQQLARRGLRVLGTRLRKREPVHPAAQRMFPHGWAERDRHDEGGGTVGQSRR